MQFSEIGQQLRAYRLESGLRAEEVAARLGVSRAALYRYEKGEVIKLDTIKRLAELLKISSLSLLGIGVEYFTRPVGFFERLRQVEEAADQILQLAGPFCYVTATDSFESALQEMMQDIAEQASNDRAAMVAANEQLLGILAARRRVYAMRRPNIIAMISTGTVQHFLEAGIGGGIGVSERARRICRNAAQQEIEHIAGLMESEPMGLQFGLLTGQEPTSRFKILRSRERASLAINPFRADTHPGNQTGVAMITSAEEAINAHQRVAENAWRTAVKGPAGATRLRQLVAMAGG
ncbi:MAG: XRE family transcriptional regulator [Acetobacteraceae bacterium]|nr:XRE family transcriptional regulator [Acetobacteraceae bacterium]MSP29566.1 XRE family transcriptional regulator [Acetobacteraceae bacterium]